MDIIGEISANPEAAVALVEGLIVKNHLIEMDYCRTIACGIDWMRVNIPEHARTRKKGKGKGK